MHLLQSGLSLDVMRDFLGQADAKTTEVYARANLEMKRKELEKVADNPRLSTIPSWEQDETSLDWLRSL